MGGLLSKAKLIREEAGFLIIQQNDTLSSDKTAGISEEDRKDILEQIDKVAAKSKIRVTPETFTIKAMKKGALLPIFVNIIGIGILAGAFFFFQYLATQAEQQIKEAEGVFASAEGRLIQELKKESEAQLLEKDREISNIQDQLSQIDRERKDLEANMDKQIADKESELRAALEAELEAERDKLAAQGIGQDDIERQLAELEAQRANEYDAQLASFRQQAETERKQVEQDLINLQNEYNQNLTALNEERDKVLSDSRKREEELRAQLEEQQAELANRESAATEELKEAQAQIKALAEERERTELVENQILGLYDGIKEDIQERSYGKALNSLENLKMYLSDDSVIILPDIARRREVDLFIIDSLNDMLEKEVEREKVDTASLITQANLITDIRTSVNQADVLASQGSIDEAELLYKDALTVIPEVIKSHNYFLQKSENQEENRQKELKQRLGNARLAYNTGKYDDTIKNYAEALEYLPEENAIRDDMILQLREAGFQLRNEAIVREESNGAAGILNNARGAFNEENYAEALSSYIELIDTYPNSLQVEIALQGIGEVIEKQNEIASTSIAALQEEKASLGEDLENVQSQLETTLATLEEQKAAAASLDEQLTLAQAELEEIKISLETATSNLEQSKLSDDEKNETINDLQSKLEAAQSSSNANSILYAEEQQQLLESNQKLNEENQTLSAQLAVLSKEIEELKQTQTEQPTVSTSVSPEVDSETLSEIDRLNAIAETYAAVQNEYQTYINKEDRILREKGDLGLVETKLHLDSFLASTSVRSSFPGLMDRIKQYDRAFEQAGHDAALLDTIDIVYNLSSYSSLPDKIEYLTEEKDRNSDDEFMTDLIDELVELVRN